MSTFLYMNGEEVLVEAHRVQAMLTAGWSVNREDTDKEAELDSGEFEVTVESVQELSVGDLCEIDEMLVEIVSIKDEHTVIAKESLRDIDAESADDADTNGSGVLSDEEVRQAAKAAGINNWHNRKIEDLKEMLGYDL